MSSSARTSPSRRPAPSARRSGSAVARRHSAPRQGPGTGDRLLSGAPGWLPAAAVLGGPILAAVVGKFVGGYHGPVFAVLTVVAAGLATASATSNGRWWVISVLPPAAWLVAAVAELAWHNPHYSTTRKQELGLVYATTHVFPVILAALLVMGLVTAAAVLRDRQRGGGRRGV